MKRQAWMAVILLSSMGLASAESYPVYKKVKKIDKNHTSYTVIDKRPKKKKKAEAAPSYAEVQVAPPALEAAAPPALPAPAEPVVAEEPGGETYSQSHNPGPAQMASNRSASFSSSIYTPGPIWSPYFNGGFNGGWNGGWNGAYYNNGYSNWNGGFNNGYCAPGMRTNLTPQRFDPLPGQHPYSIQQPRPAQPSAGGMVPRGPGFFRRPGSR